MKKSLTQTEKIQFEYLIKVLSAAVNNTSAPLPSDRVSWQSLISYAERCGVEAMFSSTVLSLPEKYLPDNDIINTLKKNAAKEMLIDGNLDYEIENLLAAFDAHNIKNLPLKGYFMKREYPRPEFRSVSDFDILFDVEQIDAVKAVFNELGYTFLHNDDNQYHFQKKPIIYVEMHTTLVHKKESYFPYLKDQLENSVKRRDYKCSYQMKPEDYYIYMLVHNSNHFRIGGMGIRMVLDTYVYYKNHQNEFDFDYLNDRLRLLNLTKYESRVREIAFNWFSSPNPKIKFDNMEVYILLSATLGRQDVAVMINSQKIISASEGQGKKKSKLAYLLSSIFPSRGQMAITYPYLNNFSFLLPISWCQMWFKRFFIEKNVHIKNGVKIRMSYTDDDVNYYLSLIDEAGFENFGIENHA